jgi:HPt (histidine-containing phosphotransfer) domain-containing protein
MTDFSQEQESPLDHQEAMKLCSQDAELLADLIEIFLQDADSRVELLAKAIDSNDLKEIGLLAHSLKGLCANICAKPLKNVSAQLEKAAEKGDLEEIVFLRKNFDKQFIRLKNTLIKQFPPNN